MFGLRRMKNNISKFFIFRNWFLIEHFHRKKKKKKRGKRFAEKKKTIFHLH